MVTCGNCGEENPDRFRFCGVCGRPLAAPTPARREIRKVVTVLFCDVVDSTRLGSRLDPESLRQVMGRYFDVARAALVRHGGTVEKFIGDAVMAVFGIPRLHEDDALRAVRAAADLRRALPELNRELEQDWGVSLAIRVGINTGQVIAGDSASGQNLVTGDAVNVAARLEQAAGPDEILIAAGTWRLVRDAVVAERVPPLTVKGKDAALEAYRLGTVRPRAPGRARRIDTPLVGRPRERLLLAQAFERAVAEQGCHLFTVLGPAGVGKSRLVYQFLSELGDRATVLRARCLDYGEGITFWPVLELVREAVAAAETDSPEQLRALLSTALAGEEHGRAIAERLVALTGSADLTGSAEEIPWAVRKLLENLARDRPLVVVIDDLHWAERTLLDLVEHIADWSRDAPILLLCLARPELLDKRPAWAGGKLNATSILLEPLSEAECHTLIEHLLGAMADVDAAAVRDRVVTAAEGNPLFVEELVAMLVEDGLLTHDGDRWVASAGLAAAPIPPTISALLAARLDRLDVTERSVIERASVVGKTFYRTAIAELSTSPTRTEVPGSLMALVRKELIRPDRSGLPGDDAFRFRHLLIRDAAYAALPKLDRAELHERFAGWLEQVAVGRLPQYEEIVGYHLEQAFRQRVEIGSRDERSTALASRAAHHLATAGRRAFARSDVPAAAALLERAYQLTPPAHRRLLTAELAEVLTHAGRLAEAARILEEVDPDTGGVADDRASLQLALSRWELRQWIEPEGWASLTRMEVERLRPALDLVGDDQTTARALSLLARAYWVEGQVARADELTRRAVEHAQRAGDVRHAGQALAQLGFYALTGPMPVHEGIARCEAMVREAGDDRRMQASVLQSLAGLHSLQGAFDRGRELSAASTAILTDLGLAFAAAQASVERAFAELYAGDPIAAEAEARRGYEVLERMGEKSYLCSAAALLALALHLQGLDHEAARFARISEETASTDDVISQLGWRGARARALADEDRLAEAEQVARAAVDRVSATDLLFFHGDALMDLARIRHRQGALDEAIQHAQHAVVLYRRKGATVLQRDAETLVEELVDERASRGARR